jgi:hypothetical protein
VKRIALALVACLGLLLAGCDDQSATGSVNVAQPTYNVTLYSGNEIVGNWLGTTYEAGPGRFWFVQPGQNTRTGVSGTVIIKKNGVQQTATGVNNYRATLYGSDKVLGTWDVEGREGDESLMKLRLPGQSEWSVAIQGTWVLQRQNVVIDPNAKGKYRVTQFDQSQHKINTFVVDGYDPKAGKVYLTLPGRQDADLCISGTFVVEPITN